MSITASNTPSEIFVDYEYGDLKEVIVGIPFMIFPDFSIACWAQEYLKILPEIDTKMAGELAERDSFETDKYAAMEEENRGLIAVLEKYGVKIWRPELLTRERIVANFGAEFLRLAGALQQYTRDPITVIGNNVIENTMGSLIRRADILGLRDLLKKRLAGANAIHAAMPGCDYAPALRDGIMDKNSFAALEGGDVIVLGKKILVGISQNRTTGSSEAGYQWLKNYLSPQGYEVEPVRLPENVMHLDIALSVPRPGLIMVCPDAFSDGVPEYFSGWNRIEVSMEEAGHMAVNGLPIDPDHYILGSNADFDSDRIKNALEAEGITVHVIPFGRHNEDGGSIRCSTHPLCRKLSR